MDSCTLLPEITGIHISLHDKYSHDHVSPYTHVHRCVEYDTASFSHASIGS